MCRNILVRFWHFPVVTLGPGKRLGIWFQGCSIHCKGCIAPENQPFDENFSVPIEKFISEIVVALPQADGITISGGEPLDQPDALYNFLRELNAQGMQDILIYSGYHKHEVFEKIPELPDMIAALISEPFIEGDITKSVWKGSDNQIITIFREKFRNSYECWCCNTERNMQLVRKSTGYYILGIPKQNNWDVIS